MIRAAITNAQLTGEGGSDLIVSALRAANPRSSATLPTADGTQGLAPRNGRACESGLLAWKVFSNEQQQHHADTLLHPLILGVMVMDCCQLTPAEMRCWQHHVATSHLLADVQDFWPVSPTFSKTGKVSLERMTGMLILMSMRKKNKNGSKS